jgi:hypothetical protein
MPKPSALAPAIYDAGSKSIYLGDNPFNDYANKPQKRLDAITGILGHEIEHAFQAKNNQKSVNDLGYQVQMKVRNPDYIGTIDITDIASGYIQSVRKH